MDFIIFASSIYPKFISNKPRRSTAKGIYLIITAIPNDEKANKEQFSTKDEHYSIRVEIDKDFADIHIFVKDNLWKIKLSSTLLIFHMIHWKVGIEPIVYAVNQIVNVKQMIDCLKV